MVAVHLVLELQEVWNILQTRYMAENYILCCQCSPFLSVNHFAFSCYMEIINQIEDDLSALIFVIKEYTFEVLKNC